MASPSSIGKRWRAEVTGWILSVWVSCFFQEIRTMYIKQGILYKKSYWIVTLVHVNAFYEFFTSMYLNFWFMDVWWFRKWQNRCNDFHFLFIFILLWLLMASCENCGFLCCCRSKKRRSRKFLTWIWTLQKLLEIAVLLVRVIHLALDRTLQMEDAQTDHTVLWAMSSHSHLVAFLHYVYPW